MSADTIAILTHERLTDGNVVGIAHDWGTYLLSQLAFRYPEYFKQFVFISVPYQPPGRGIDVERVNTMSKKQNGFENFGYWLFSTSPEAGKLIGQNWESFFSLAYCEDARNWATDFAGIDAMKNFISADRRIPVGSWVGDVGEEKRLHHEMFGDDYSAPLTWYRRGIESLGREEEVELLKRGEVREKIGKETLMITGTEDRVCNAAHGRAVMTAFVENPQRNLQVVDLEAGHWVMLERKDEMNRSLENFLEKGVGGNMKSKI